MRKSRRQISLFLVGILFIISLTGCGKTGTGPGTEAASGSLDHSVPESSMTYNGQDVTEPVELIMYFIGDETADQDLILEEVNKILKDRINATLVLRNMSASDYTTKYALTIVSGESIDLIYTSTWAYYQSEASKGAFAAVTEQIISGCMPLHRKYQAEASWDQARIGDEVYFVPCNSATVGADTIMIRGDLREKYGLDRLRTIEDLEEYYTAVTEDADSGVRFPYEAGLNNDTSKSVILFSQNDWMSVPGSLIFYFAVKYSEEVSEDDLFWIFGTEEYLEYAKMMKRWADQGFWPRNALANTTDTSEAFRNGTSASYSQNLGSVGAVASAVSEEHPEWKPEIYDLTPEANRFLGSYTGDGFAVLSTSQNQKRAFMALDLLKFDEQLYNLVRHGIEGVHYVKAGEKMWAPGPEMNKHPFGNAFSWGFKNGMYELTREDTFPEQVEIGKLWDEKGIDGPLTSFSFDDSRVKNEMALLKEIYTQYVPMLDLGLAEDVEKTLAEFNQKSQDAGLQKVIDEAVDQLQVFLDDEWTE